MSGLAAARPSADSLLSAGCAAACPCVLAFRRNACMEGAATVGGGSHAPRFPHPARSPPHTRARAHIPYTPEYRRAANRAANNGLERKDLYTDNWAGSEYRGSQFNVSLLHTTYQPARPSSAQQHHRWQ